MHVYLEAVVITRKQLNLLIDRFGRTRAGITAPYHPAET